MFTRRPTAAARPPGVLPGLTRLQIGALDDDAERAHAIAQVKRDANDLKHVSKELKNDMKVVLAASDQGDLSDEFRALADLKHPYIVQVCGFTLGSPPSRSDKSWIVILELCDRDLEDLLDKKSEEMPWSMRLAIGQMIASGMAERGGVDQVRCWPSSAVQGPCPASVEAVDK